MGLPEDHVRGEHQQRLHDDRGDLRLFEIQGHDIVVAPDEQNELADANRCSGRG